MKNVLDPFAQFSAPKAQTTLGGARADVQQTSEAHMQNRNTPFLVARIYASPSLTIPADSDPRYGDKADNVENVYLAPNRPAETAGDKSQGGAKYPSRNAGLFPWVKF